MDSQEVLKECLDKFSTPDYIMEPGIFTQLKRYFQAGGTPEHVINLLSHNYTAVAQMTNLLAEWLITAGVKVTDVQAMVENHLKEMILKTFDPKKADTIFTEEGEVSGADNLITYMSLISNSLSNRSSHLFMCHLKSQNNIIIK